MELLYPVGPTCVSGELTRPTPKYRVHAWLAMGALVAFVGMYVALTGWLIATAWRLFAATEGAGANFFLGLAAAVLVGFLIKALFFLKKGGLGDLAEVTEAREPHLFAFLYRLSDELGAPRPYRVFLSARVNACVFYDLR